MNKFMEDVVETLKKGVASGHSEYVLDFPDNSYVSFFLTKYYDENKVSNMILTFEQEKEKVVELSFSHSIEIVKRLNEFVRTTKMAKSDAHLENDELKDVDSIVKVLEDTCITGEFELDFPEFHMPSDLIQKLIDGDEALTSKLPSDENKSLEAVISGNGYGFNMEADNLYLAISPFTDDSQHVTVTNFGSAEEKEITRMSGISIVTPNCSPKHFVENLKTTEAAILQS